MLALDPRGMGETAAGFKENHLVSNGVLLGRPVFAQRMWDVMQAAAWLARQEGVDPARVMAFGREGGGLLAVCAAALGAPLEKVHADRMLARYTYFFENDQPQPIWLCVPDILEVTDIPAVAGLLGERLLLNEPVGYGKTPLPMEEVVKLFPAAR